MAIPVSPDSRWATRRAEKHRRLAQVRSMADGVVVPTDRIVGALELDDVAVARDNGRKQ